MKPRVSVVLPARNAEATIEDALASVFGQSLADFECIVLDDGSTDRTAERAAASGDPRLRVVRLPGIGVVGALRRGVEEASAPYIARLDADDTWADNAKLARQVDYLDAHPECVVVGTWFIASFPDGSHEVVRPPAGDRELKRDLLRRATFAHPTVVFRKSVYEEVGGYRAHFGTFAEDVDLWFRMGKRGVFHVLPIVGLNYCVQETRWTKELRESLKLIVIGCENLPSFRRYPGLPVGVLWGLRRLVLAVGGHVRRVGRRNRGA